MKQKYSNTSKLKNKTRKVQYRFNSKGEKRRIIFSVPLISLVLFVILIYMLTTEIYSDYNTVDMNDVIKNFDVKISTTVIEDMNDQIYNIGLENFSSEEPKKTKIRTSIPSNNEENQQSLTSEKVSQNNYVTSSGEKYHIIANLKIPSLGIDYPVLSQTSDSLLKISLTKYWGADPNQEGNMVVLGHNYESKKFFSKLHTIKKGAKIEVTDLSDKTLEYTVYSTQVISPYDNSVTSQLTDGHTEITLITCYNRDANRFCVKARAK